MRRLFIAIEIPDEVKKSIATAVDKIKKDVAGTFVSPEKLHISILFLGSPKQTDDEIIEALKTIEFDKEVEIGGLGAFPSMKNPRTLFVKVHTDLEDVHKLLTEKIGLPARDGPFIPHITICRMKETPTGKIDDSIFGMARFRAKKLTLFDSDFKSYRRVY